MRKHGLGSLSCLWLGVLITYPCQASVQIKQDWMTRTGDVLQFVLPIGAGYYSYLNNDQIGLRSVATATPLTLAEVYGLKSIIHATSPNGKNSRSFPSGHTAAAFSGSTYLWLRYGSTIGVPATALASLTAASRVHGHYHYTRDVLAGAALASLNQYLMLRYYNHQTKYQVSVNRKSVALRYVF